MSPEPLSGGHSPPLLALAGFCSALLTIGITSFPGFLDQYVVAPGLSFGLLIPLYFALYERAGSAWRSLAFLLTSIAAYEASMCAAFLIRIVLPGNLNNPATGPTLFAGGLVGGFIVLMAASTLFGRSQDNLAVPRVLAASLTAGVLAVAGWPAGRVLGLAFNLPPPKTIPGESPNGPESISLYIVWQTGTALLLGWVVAAERAASATGSLPSTVAPHRPRASRTKIALASLFFCAVFGFLGWFFVYNLQIKRDVERSDQVSKNLWARRDQVFKQYVAETPPLAGLPPIQPIGPEQALILEDIAGFRPEPAASVSKCSQLPLFKGAAPEGPCVIYAVVYKLPNQPEPPASSGSVLWHPVRISVRVTQYPNDAWARHKGRGYAAPLDDPQSVTVNSATSTDHVMRTTWVNGAGTNVSYVWPSGSIVVRVEGTIANLTDDFLRRYLAKYPSSL